MLTSITLIRKVLLYGSNVCLEESVKAPRRSDSSVSLPTTNCFVESLKCCVTPGLKHVCVNEDMMFLHLWDSREHMLNKFFFAFELRCRACGNKAGRHGEDGRGWSWEVWRRWIISGEEGNCSKGRCRQYFQGHYVEVMWFQGSTYQFYKDSLRIKANDQPRRSWCNGLGVSHYFLKAQLVCSIALTDQVIERRDGLLCGIYVLY